MDSTRHNWRARIAVVLAAFAGMAFLRETFWPALWSVTHGFPTYYVSARLILDHRWSPQVYDDSWFAGEVRSVLRSEVGEVYAPNPPSTSLLMTPIAWLDSARARVVWQVLNLIFLAAGVSLVLGALEPRGDPTLRAASIAVTFNYAPLRENFRLGQVYVLVFALLAAVFWGLRQRRWALAGTALGAAAAFKLSGVPVWLTLGVRRQWREILVGGLAGLVVVLLSLAAMGRASWITFLQLVPTYWLGKSWAAVVAFQTTPSFFRHLFVVDAEWNPQPLWHQPWLAAACATGVSLAALSLTLWKGRCAQLDLAFAASLSLGVVLFPLAEEYHYTLLLLPLAVMGARVARRPFVWLDCAWLAVSVALLAAPWPYEHPWFSDGWRVLLAYPRLYGGWLVWVWLLRQMSIEAERTDRP